MSSSLKGKTVLILGGPGLVGRNVADLLLAHHIGKLAVVGIAGEGGWAKLKVIEKKYDVRIQKFSVNLLVPPKFAKQSLHQILSKPSECRGLSRALMQSLNRHEIDRQPLYKVVHDVRPDIIVDAINTATQCAYIEQSSDAVENAGLGSLLLLRYYQILHHYLQRDFWTQRKLRFHIEQYLKVGTTGIGGMGLDIPFTHGEERPSLSLMKKVAMAGAQTNILVAMHSSRRMARIQEVVPATAIFQLSNFNPFPKNIRDTQNIKHTEIDGGESQGYALEEFRLLTDKRQMGVIDAKELAAIIVDALVTGHSRHDVLAAMIRSGVSRSARSADVRQGVLGTWVQNQSRHHVPSIAHGHLGPWRTRKLLFELSILLDYFGSHRQHFLKFSPRTLQKEIWSAIKADKPLREEVNFANLRLSQHGSAKPQTADQEIDISSENIARWRKTLFSLGLRKQRKPWYAGDVLALLVSERYDLRAIP